MARKSHYIQTINHKDTEFLNALRCGGVATKSQITKHFISSNRLKNYVLDRIIEKCSHIAKDGTRHEVYRITDKGKAWIRTHIPELSDRKYYSSTGVEHDLKLMDKIISLSHEERQTMRCEAEIRDEFKLLLDRLLQEQEYERYEKLFNALESHSISMPDLAYGQNEYYEAITSSYTDAQITAKIEAVAAIEGNLQMERI